MSICAHAFLLTLIFGIEMFLLDVYNNQSSNFNRSLIRIVFYLLSPQKNAEFLFDESTSAQNTKKSQYLNLLFKESNHFFGTLLLFQFTYSSTAIYHEIITSIQRKTNMIFESDIWYAENAFVKVIFN